MSIMIMTILISFQKSSEMTSWYLEVNIMNINEYDGNIPLRNAVSLAHFSYLDHNTSAIMNIYE